MKLPTLDDLVENTWEQESLERRIPKIGKQLLPWTPARLSSKDEETTYHMSSKYNQETKGS
eukprot:2767165-Amphidinium_carterae.1